MEIIEWFIESVSLRS